MTTRTAMLVALTITLAAPVQAATFLIQSGDDTSPYSFLPTLPRGNHETMYAFTGEDDSGLSHNFETYLRMDLPLELLGSGDLVSEAYLWVTYSFNFTAFGDSADVAGEMHLHRVLEPWSEASMTWSNRPAYGSTLTLVPNITGLGLIWFDVTELVRDWLDGAPNYGVALTNPTQRLIGMYAFEANVDPNLRPGLVIQTVPEPHATLLLGAAGFVFAVLSRRRPASRRWRE